MLDRWIIQNADTAQVVLFFALFAIFALAELLAPKRTGDAHRKERWFTNLLLTFLNIGVMILLPVTLLGAAVWSKAQGYGIFNNANLAPGVFIVGNLLARGFISFFTHFLMHKLPILWRIHRVHHLDTELDISTTVRFHPLEFLAGLLPGVPLAIGFGISPWVLLLYELLDAAITLFSHANISLPQRLERLLRYIIVTPDLHRIHHSSWQPETDSNFGAVFPIWDILFGTFRTQTREPQATMTLGLNEVRDKRSYHLLWLLGSPLIGKFRGAGAESRPLEQQQ
jgi:sterol desaturase/sphingolipid hydroxylase (fatty acid hydroxylase superfamily)